MNEVPGHSNFAEAIHPMLQKETKLDQPGYQFLDILKYLPTVHEIFELDQKWGYDDNEIVYSNLFSDELKSVLRARLFIFATLDVFAELNVDAKALFRQLFREKLIKNLVQTCLNPEASAAEFRKILSLRERTYWKEKQPTPETIAGLTQFIAGAIKVNEERNPDPLIHPKMQARINQQKAQNQNPLLQFLQNPADIEVIIEDVFAELK